VEDFENEVFKELEDIPGVGPATAEKLRKAGILTPRQLALYGLDELLMYVDVDDYSRINRALMRVRRAFRPQKVLRASEYASMRSELPRLTTGVKSIDQLLEGGLEPRCIYEVVGEYGTGKSQLCFQLSTTVQLTVNRGGVGGKAFYIDTEGTFSESRIAKIGERFNIEDPLSGVLVFQPMNVDEQIDCIRTILPKYIEEEGVKLAVVDSLISHVRAEYRGREMLVARQQTLNYMLNFLLRVAMMYNVYVIVTNHVVAKPVAGGGVTAAGGHVVAHGTTHRLFMAPQHSKRQGILVRRMLVEDSPYLQRGSSATFGISEKGLVDVL